MAANTSKLDWAEVARDLKPVYTAGSEAVTLDAFAEFSCTLEKQYPAVVRLWENAWAEFVPSWPSTGKSGRSFARPARSSPSAPVPPLGQGPRALPACEQAAMRHLYLVIISWIPPGKAANGGSNRRKAALNAFDSTFDGRLSAGIKAHQDRVTSS